MGQMSVLAGVLALVAAVCCSDVIVLTSDNFDTTIKAHSPLLVEFYAPWCGHCKTLEPEYEKAATALKEKGISIAKVDATVEKDIATKFQVTGYPSLKLFKNGEVLQDFKGPRNVKGIISFMERKVGSPLIPVTTVDEVMKALDEEKYGVIVGYFDDTTSDEYRKFEELADLEMSTKFLIFSDPGPASSCFLSEVQLDDNTALVPGSIVMIGKDGTKTHYNGEVGEGLVNFFFDKVLDQSMELDPDLFTKILANHPIVVVMLDTTDESAASIRKMATDAIKAQPTLRQLFADKTKWGQALVRMGSISGKVFPTAVYFPMEFSQANPPLAWDEDAPFTEDAYKSWLAKLVAGTAEGWKQSEPIPESNDGPVKIVVHNNFNSIVMDPTKNVLLELYAPWCGHCKSLEPIYKTVGEYFADDPTVVIAKMDATANFVDPKYPIRGFPTIKFFPAGKEKKDVLTYEGSRTYDDLIEFVKNNRNSK